MRLGLSSDLLSPIVVKELRQELRMKSFTHFFVWPQVVLAISLLFQFMASSERSQVESAGLVEVLFWLTFGVPLVLFLPRRAGVSFTKEEQSNSLELMLLSQLSAWRITFGKWCALALQCALFVVAGLPYISLRYFLSGIDLVASLQAVFLMFLVVLVLLALGLLTSAQGRKRRGAGPFMIIAVLFLIGPGIGLFANFARATSFSFLGFENNLIIIFFTGVAIYQLLILASTHVSPVHEDNAIKARLAVGSTLLVSAALLYLGIGQKALVITLLCTLVVPVVIHMIPTLPHPLIAWKLRHGRPLLTWLSSDGWPGAVLNATIVAPLSVFILVTAGVIPASKGMVLLLLGLAGILLPRALLFLIAPARHRRLGAYVFVHVALLVFASLTLPFAARDMTHLCFLYPPMALFILLVDPGAMHLVPAAIAGVLMLVFSYVVLSLEFSRLKMELSRLNVQPRSGGEGE